MFENQDMDTFLGGSFDTPHLTTFNMLVYLIEKMPVRMNSKELVWTDEKIVVANT